MRATGAGTLATWSGCAVLFAAPCSFALAAMALGTASRLSATSSYAKLSTRKPLGSALHAEVRATALVKEARHTCTSSLAISPLAPWQRLSSFSTRTSTRSLKRQSGSPQMRRMFSQRSSGLARLQVDTRGHDTSKSIFTSLNPNRCETLATSILGCPMQWFSHEWTMTLLRGLTKKWQLSLPRTRT